MSKPVCIFQAPMWTRSGYGDLALAYAKSLMRYDKFDIHFVPTRWGGCSRKFLLEDIHDPVEKEMFAKVLRKPLTKQPEVFMQCSIPNEFQTPAKYNIGITAGIETTVARVEWVEGLNKMNMNIVTSQHAKTVFENATYKKEVKGQQPIEVKSLKPIEVLFWGQDTKIYNNSNPTQPLVEAELANIQEDWCYLFVGQWTSNGLFSDRKDIGNMIRVFLETFAGMSGKPRPALILKTSGAAICNMDKYDTISKIKAVRQFVENKGVTDLPNVYLVYGELTEPEMNSLYNHSKVKAHISFTHGEGFGNPLLLSTLSGKPLLVSNWSGHLDFLDPKLCKLLVGEVKQIDPSSSNEWLIKESGWFTVNYSFAAEAMKNCFYYYNAYKEKAEQLRVRNMEQFSEQAMDKVFHGLLEKYIPKFSVETKLVLPKLKKVESVKKELPPIEEPKKEVTTVKV